MAKATRPKKEKPAAKKKKSSPKETGGITEQQYMKSVGEGGQAWEREESIQCADNEIEEEDK